MAIKDSIFIVTHNACGGCKEIVKHLEGKIPIYDLDKSDDAMELVHKGIVTGVPSAYERVGNKYHKCKIGEDEDGHTIIIMCPNQQIEVEKDN